MIIGISGKKRSGKDTVGKHLRTKGYQRVAFADHLKSQVANAYNIAEIFFHNDGLKESPLRFLPVDMAALDFIGVEDLGLMDEKYYHTPRSLCILEGMFKRVVDPNFWVKSALDSVTGENIVVTDVRYQNEAEYIKSLGGILIRVESERSPKSTHISETDLDDYEGFDAKLINNGTIEQLYKSVDSVLQSK